MKTLRQAKVGETLKVVKLHGEGAVKRRIMDMGITRGVELNIRKVAPLGDPVEITVRGYELSIRKADARDSFTFTIRFPPIAETIRTVPPVTKPRFSKCCLTSGLPPIFFMIFSSPISANVKGIISLRSFLQIVLTNSMFSKKVRLI